MPKIPIKVTIRIGKAKKDCAGFSVCELTIGTSVNVSVIAYDADKEILDISIPERFLEKEQPDKLHYFKEQNSVTFEEEYTIPREIQEELKATHPLVIPMEKCPLSFEGGTYIIKNIPVQR